MRSHLYEAHTAATAGCVRPQEAEMVRVAAAGTGLSVGRGVCRKIFLQPRLTATLTATASNLARCAKVCRYSFCSSRHYCSAR